MRVYWPTRRDTKDWKNCGDILTPWMMRHMGVEPEHTESGERNKLLGAGSIVSYVQPGDVVWGSGIMRRNDAGSADATFLAVRGPLTREWVLRKGGSCPKIFGDPALLMPRFYSPKVEKTRLLGVIPHYIDADLVDPSMYHTIDITGTNPLKVIDSILECENIISSSLHGIILAHAYGIPAAWVKLSNRLAGDDSKFGDYFLSVGMNLYPPQPSVEKASSHLPKTVHLDLDLDKLWDVCPFNKTGESVID